jgi:hypothetical protein
VEEQSNDAAEEAQADLLTATFERGAAHERGNRGDLLRTDNSAVVARLSAENERLRAALKKVVSIRMAAGDQSVPTIEVCLNALNPEYKLSTQEGDAA